MNDWFALPCLASTGVTWPTSLPDRTRNVGEAR